MIDIATAIGCFLMTDLAVKIWVCIIDICLWVCIMINILLKRNDKVIF